MRDSNNTPKLGIRIPPCDNIEKVAAAIALAEQLGFDSAWVADSQLIWRDTFMTLALAAQKTTRITLATAVTNVATRHVTVVASAVRSLQELAPGRVSIGIGVGASSTGMSGLKRTSQRTFRDDIEVLRTLLSGGSIRVGDGQGRLTGAVGPCPIYLGSNGPRSLRLAGELGEGVITTNGLATGVFEHRLKHIREGAEATGRSLESLDVVAWAPTHVTDDLEADLKLLKPAVAAFLTRQPAADLALAGIHERLSGPLPSGFEPDGLHISDWNLAVEPCDAIVSDALARDWVNAFCVVGSAATLPKKLGEIAARGVTTLIVTPLVGDNSQTLPTQLMRDLSAALGRSADTMGNIRPPGTYRTLVRSAEPLLEKGS